MLTKVSLGLSYRGLERIHLVSGVGFGCRVSGFGFRVSGFGFLGSGFGFVSFLDHVALDHTHTLVTSAEMAKALPPPAELIPLASDSSLSFLRARKSTHRVCAHSKGVSLGRGARSLHGAFQEAAVGQGPSKRMEAPMWTRRASCKYLRAKTATLAPSAARFLATASPMPLLAPVTMITLPSSLPISGRRESKAEGRTRKDRHRVRERHSPYKTFCPFLPSSVPAQPCIVRPHSCPLPPALSLPACIPARGPAAPDPPPPRSCNPTFPQILRVLARCREGTTSALLSAPCARTTEEAGLGAGRDGDSKPMPDEARPHSKAHRSMYPGEPHPLLSPLLSSQAVWSRPSLGEH
jgi:hypothetical protein